MARLLKAVPEAAVDLTRSEAIAAHEQLLALHQRQLAHWRVFVEVEEGMVSALTREIRYLRDTSDNSFDSSLVECRVEDEEDT